MTDKQQTAVEWLVEQIKSDQNQKALSASKWVQVIKQAKEMEREQIETAYNQGIEATFQFHYGDGKQYFTDTYQTEP